MKLLNSHGEVMQLDLIAQILHHHNVYDININFGYHAYSICIKQNDVAIQMFSGSSFNQIAIEAIKYLNRITKGNLKF